MNPSLFGQVLGDAFHTLPQRIRDIHSIAARESWRGEATITRGTHPIANLLARIVGLPPSGARTPTTVEFVVEDGSETWRRDFGGARMVSRYRARGGRLRERLGPMEFVFALEARDGEIFWRTVGVRLFGVLPLPASWFTQVLCREREFEGRYEFLVEASMPLIGRLIRYEGWLVRA